MNKINKGKLLLTFLVVVTMVIFVGNKTSYLYASDSSMEATGLGTEADPRSVYNYIQLKDALESDLYTYVCFVNDDIEIIEEG